jgi:hypothetical protein
LLKELREAQDRVGLKQLNRELRAITDARWQQIEDGIKQPISKY